MSSPRARASPKLKAEAQPALGYENTARAARAWPLVGEYRRSNHRPRSGSRDLELFPGKILHEDTFDGLGAWEEVVKAFGA